PGEFKSMEGIRSAAIAGAVVGLGGFAVMLLAGWELYHRLWPDSLLAMLIFLTIFGLIGAYLGWLAGMVVFSALLGSKSPIQGGPSEGDQPKR
ncbi:MAG: hypothetical protein ACREN8_09920, partial [Candidatus Dormibacteraceae bacterium]